MLELTLTGAEVLLPDGLAVTELSICGGQIVSQSQPKQVDLRGFQVLPGIIDIHGDGFERHLAPRRGVMKDLREGLSSAENELAANGITTAYLAQFWSWEGGMRGPDFARRFLQALQEYDGLGTDLRAQLRFEYAMIDDYAEVEALIAAHGIDYVVFNDHLPHAALSKGKKPPRLTGQALKGGRSPEAHLALMQVLFARFDAAKDAVSGLSQRLAKQGRYLGSHDDATGAQRAAWRAQGVEISEFPETREAAEAAFDTGGSVVLGAPNVVRGGSHSGNISAAELVEQGLCSALASDYHYPAPRQAALVLAQSIGLPQAWALLSSGPAAVLGLQDRGEVSLGKRADLIILDGQGRLGCTMAAGRITYLSGEVAARFLAGAR
ncbi:MAG: alpha-D-ribose 1-methylphosphonate 5-triphosphate diphosphatase [Thalassovita sp.]